MQYKNVRITHESHRTLAMLSSLEDRHHYAIIERALKLYSERDQYVKRKPFREPFEEEPEARMAP